MVHNLLNQNVAKNYVPYQMLENKQMSVPFPPFAKQSTTLIFPLLSQA